MRISECAGLVSSAAASQRTLRSSASLAITSGSKRRSEGTKDQMRLEVAWLSSSATGSPRAAVVEIGGDLYAAREPKQLIDGRHGRMLTGQDQHMRDVPLSLAVGAPHHAATLPVEGHAYWLS